MIKIKKEYEDNNLLEEKSSYAADTTQSLDIKKEPNQDEYNMETGKVIKIKHEHEDHIIEESYINADTTQTLYINNKQENQDICLQKFLESVVVKDEYKQTDVLEERQNSGALQTDVIKRPKTNAEICKKYYQKKKAAREAERIRQGLSTQGFSKQKRKTGAERARIYRIRKKMLRNLQEKQSSITDILSTSSTSNSPMRTSELASTSNQAEASTVSSTGGKYMQCYKHFTNWQEQNNIRTFDEDALLAYFNDLSKTSSANALWNRWFMISSVFDLQHGIDTNTYHKVKKLIIDKALNYNNTNTKALTLSGILKFIDKAQDFQYLAVKVILIIAWSGSLDASKLCDLRLNDIEVTNKKFIVKVKDNKFVIADKFYDFVERYICLRPADIETDRLFIEYSNGKCTRQVMAKNKIAESANIVATYLNLKEPHKYTDLYFQNDVLHKCVPKNNKSNDNVNTKSDKSLMSNIKIDKIENLTINYCKHMGHNEDFKANNIVISNVENLIINYCQHDK